jgi:hypothetical protein
MSWYYIFRKMFSIRQTRRQTEDSGPLPRSQRLEVVLEHGQNRSRRLHKDRGRRSPAHRLEAQRSRAGVEVQHRTRAHPIAQDVEEHLTHMVPRGPDPGRRNADAAAAPLTGDNPDSSASVPAPRRRRPLLPRWARRVRRMRGSRGAGRSALAATSFSPARQRYTSNTGSPSRSVISRAIASTVLLSVSTSRSAPRYNGSRIGISRATVSS